MAPTVSVVIAHYNGSEYIERALRSAFDQTSKPSEVIVVDDGSTAEELDFLKKLLDEFPFKLITQENSGQSAARNTGAENSTSEFICLLDQDDYFLPNHIETLLGPIGTPEDHDMLAFTFGDLWRGSEDGIVMTHTCVHDTGRQPKNRLIDLISTDMMILPSATLIRRRAFIEIGGFDPQFRGYEDDDLFLRFFANGYASIFIDKAVTFWTINTSSTSYSESMSRSRFAYYKKLMATFPAGSLPNISIYDHLIVPRFAFQFVADVIGAALSGSKFFGERQERLRAFVSDYKEQNQVDSKRMKKTTFLALPFVNLDQKNLRHLILLSQHFPKLLSKFVHPQAANFIRGQILQARSQK